MRPDGAAGRTFGFNACALFYQDIVYDVIVYGNDLDAGFDGQRSAFFYDVLATQAISGAAGQRYIFGDASGQRGFGSRIVATVVCCFVVTAGSEECQTGQESQ